MDSGEILGVKGINGENLSSGVGFVIIPPGIDKNIFKKDCYMSNTVSMAGFDFGHIHNVHVDKEVMQRIKFPDEVGEMGSPVVFINIAKHNVPIIIACLKEEKDIFTVHENKTRSTKSSGQKIVDLDMDAEDGKVSISVSGDETTPAIIEFLVKGNHKGNHIKIEVDGVTYIKSKDKILMISEKAHELIVLNKKGIVTAKFKLSSTEEERLFYQDEYDNLISIGKEGINIDDANGNKIKINESGISIDAGNNEMKLMSNDSIVQIGEGGINIDSGKSSVTINGSFEALYNKIPGVPISSIGQIGVSKKVKIG